MNVFLIQDAKMATAVSLGSAIAILDGLDSYVIKVSLYPLFVFLMKKSVLFVFNNSFLFISHFMFVL